MSLRTKPSFLFRLFAWLSTPGGIGALFVLGLAIRLVLAPADGFPTDMSAFKAWAGRLADRGPWNFYPRAGEDYFVDYPPGYLYVLWVLGRAARLLGDGSIPDVWIKLPPILADLGLAALAMVGAQRLAPVATARRIPIRAIAAAAILLNPAVFFVSAVWGQADSVLAVLVVGSLVLIGTGPPTLRREAAGMALLAIAVGTKPQAGFLIPVVILVLVWRHIHGRVAAADDPRMRRREGWTGVARVGATGLAGVAAGFALFAPFRLFPADALDFYSKASRTYKVTSVFAFNLWGAVGFWRPDSGDDAVTFLGVPVVFWGIGAFVVIGSLVLARAWTALRRGVDQGRVLVFGSMAFALVGFAVVTRIHERYLFLPLALAALVVAYPFLRRALLVLSLLYLVNVLFPYIYYLEREGRSVPTGGIFDVLYGPDFNGARMKVLSLVITVACLAIVWVGWRALEASPAGVVDPVELVQPEVVEAAAERAPWTFELHPIGRRGSLIALAVFALAMLSRVAGLGHPPGMYFDEVYHARTGAEYLGNKEVFEYTHPPFAKEVIGFAIHHLSGFRSETGGRLPAGVAAEGIGPRPDGVVWVRNTSQGATLEIGRIDADCGLRRAGSAVETDVRGSTVAATQTGLLFGGVSEDGPVLVRFEQGEERWRAVLPAEATAIATVAERAFVVTTEGELVTVSPEGEPDVLALGASALAASSEAVWVAFPDDKEIASWDAERKRTNVIDVQDAPDAIAAPEDVERVFVSVGSSVVSYDTGSDSVHETIEGPADLLGTIPETTAVWAVAGTRIRVIEPHSGVVIGRLGFDARPAVVSADAGGHRLIGIADGRVMCAEGRPQFAWRLGSAIAGSAMVALAFLLGLRLFGSLLAASLGALFLAVDGLAFTISRIAMNDSYTTAFILGAWFCVLSALRESGRRADRTADGADLSPRDRTASIAWLGAAGVCAGLGLASKWVALYAIAGIGLLLLWDGFTRREASIWRIAGRFGPSVFVLAFFLGVLPLAIYVLTYTPYFSLGHGFGDLVRLQRDMFSYHAGLEATHPFGSQWYGWPVGYRAVFLYLAGSDGTRSEIWSIPNLVVWWGGLAALGAMAVRIRKTHAAALGVVVLGAAVQYAPWMAVTRVTFMYHFLAVVPWLAIALGWFLAVGLRDWKYQKVAIVAVPVAAVAVFAFLYPILVGWDMPSGYLDLVRELFPWVI